MPGEAMAHLFTTALGAFLAAIVLTWLVRRVALAIGVMDRPDGVRKLHRQPIPLLGGVGVFGAWLIGIMTCLALERETNRVSGEWLVVSGEGPAAARMEDRGSRPKSEIRNPKPEKEESRASSDFEFRASNFGVDPPSSVLDPPSSDHSPLTTHDSPVLEFRMA